VRILEGETPRVLICTDTYPPQVNGVSVVTAISVAGLQARGWECAVVSPRYPKPYGQAFAADAPDLSAVRAHIKLPSVPLPRYPENRISIPMYERVLHAAREFRPHLVHCETEFVVGRLGQRVAHGLGVPAVSSYHTDFSRYTESYGVGWLRPVVSGWLARFHRRSARVYTPSDPARLELHKMGVGAVEVWGRGTDVEQFHPAKRNSAVRWRLGGVDTLVFLHVGRMAAEKNVGLLLDAFTLFRSARPDIRASLVIAGDGPELPALRRRATGEVRFLGNMHRRLELPELYASADAFVFASTTETLGLVVLEAMASGLPVLAAPVGGVADNLRHGVNGLAFAAGDAGELAQLMARVADDPELRRRLGAGARTWSEARSWDAELDRLDQSYREVITLRGPQAALREPPPSALRGPQPSSANRDQSCQEERLAGIGTASPTTSAAPSAPEQAQRQQ
jgi:phosphatidylinositol alpha 1,6-mannosyltransferase